MDDKPHILIVDDDESTRNSLRLVFARKGYETETTGTDCHHEKWDGTGYPRGLKTEQIPLAAHIFAVVDVWDALLSDRPYRPAWSEEDHCIHP